MDKILNTMRLHYRGSLFVAALFVLVWIGIKFVTSYTIQMILPELLKYIQDFQYIAADVVIYFLNPRPSYGRFIMLFAIPLPIYGFFALLLIKNLELQIKEKIISLVYGGHWFWVFFLSVVCAPVIIILFLFNGFKITQREH